MTGFEPRISGSESNRSTNWATTTSQNSEKNFAVVITSIQYYTQDFWHKGSLYQDQRPDSLPVWPDWAIYCCLGNILKSLGTLFWPNLLGNI